MKQESGFTWKLGMFILIGLVLFVALVYFVGKQKNMFGSTIRLKAKFKTVSGLKVGNNVRFSGINIGTVDLIELATDTIVNVEIIIKKEVQQFIKSDALASIGSDGLMGDKVLTISPGTPSNKEVKDNDVIGSKTAIEMEDIMNSIKTSVDNAGIITAQIAEFSSKMNNGNGALSKLISDENLSNSITQTVANLQVSSQKFAKFTTNMTDGKFSRTLDTTMMNIKSATKGLDENMEAAKSNFLLRGFFKKKAKAEAKANADAKAKAKKVATQRSKDSLNAIKNIKIIKDTVTIKE